MDAPISDPDASIKLETLRHVAIVDDDGAVRSSVSALLKRAGFEVASFADAETFLNAVGELPMGLVITDVRLPGLNGIELMGRLHALGEGGRPVIIATGYGTVPLAVEAMKAGAVDMLEKPIRPLQLLAALEKMREHVRPRPTIRLTGREREIADALTRGKTSKTIATALGISHRTVEVVRARMLKKAGVANTAALITFLARADWR